jgi:hypothetical protein
MTEPRLAANVSVAALRRQAEALGAFAVVLRKGDAISGSILLIRREKGQNPTLFERFQTPAGAAEWVEKPYQTTDKEKEISDFLARRAERDPDIWIIELDVPLVERFTDILAAIA